MHATDVMKDIIEANGREVTRLHRRMHETYALRDESEAHRRDWEAACDEFRRRYDALAFPGGYTEAGRRIANVERNTVEAALCFLELRPYYFRSGYMYDALLRKMKRAPLTEPQRARLDEVLRLRAAWIARRNAEREERRRTPPESRHN
jgi:hypothetical protein